MEFFARPGVVRYDLFVRRFVIFLGIFSGLVLLALVVTAALVQAGSLRADAHWELGWAFVIPFFAYLWLSLREIVKRRWPKDGA